MKKILTPTNYELIPLNDKTNVRFFTSIDPGSYVAPHWHDAVEIVYLLEGELKVIVGNDSRNLKAGQCAMVTPNQIHSTLCTSPNRAIVFQIPEAFMEKFIPNARNLCFSLQDPAASPVLQSKVELFKETLIKMQFLTDLQPDGAVLRFNSLLFETLFQLYHNFCTEAPKKDTVQHSRNLERLEPVLQYIASNYNRPISLEEISGVAILQPKYFCRFFKNAWESPFWNIRTKSVCQRFIRMSPPPATKYLTFWNATALPIISCSAECFLNGFMPPLRKSASMYPREALFIV